MAIPMRPLSCAEVRQEVARRAFEALEPHVESSVSAHLAVCDDCRLHAEDVERGVRRMATSLLREDPPPDLERRLRDTIRSAPIRRPRSRRRLATATLAVAFIVVGVTLVAAARPSSPGPSAVLSPADRAARADGVATLEGPPTARRVRLTVKGLPSLAEGSAYGLWVSGGSGKWQLLGQFRSSSHEALYPLRGQPPELVRVTVERSDTTPDAPGLEVLTGRF